MNRVLMFIMFVCTVYIVFTILKLFGVFEFKKGTDRAIKNYKKRAFSTKLRDFVSFKLDMYESMANTFSFLSTKAVLESHKYFIDRLDIKTETLNRKYTAEELRGKYILVLLLGVGCIPLSLLSRLFLVVSGLCIVLFFIYSKKYELDVRDEDEVIDIYFCDLFLLIYSQLRKGSKGKLKTVVMSYQRSLNNLGNSRMCKVMGKLTEYLLSNLSMYPDDVAVSMLKDRYMSSTLVNFSNLATQALQGVDNYDTLLSFRLDLVRRKSDSMRKKTDKLIEIGTYSVYAIYIILFQFILLSFIAKLPSNLISMFK